MPSPSTLRLWACAAILSLTASTFADDGPAMTPAAAKKNDAPDNQKMPGDKPSITYGKITPAGVVTTITIAAP